MADHVLETRIVLRYGTYAQWMESKVVLMPGEAAIATFPDLRILESLTNSIPEHTPPAVGIKIGDGLHEFKALPWVQSIAADVYNWAKQENKPTYSATEIQGLQEYINQYAPAIPGDGTIAPRIYQLTSGTGANANKYYLRYKESENTNNWVVDTEHYIDLSDLTKIFNWIGEDDLRRFPSLGNRTEQHIQYKLDELIYPDPNQPNYNLNGNIVTDVTQTSGKISVTKRNLTTDDITGILPITKGGTGTNNFEAGEVLIGNGTDRLQTLPIDTTLTNNNHLSYNYAIKTYIDDVTAGLEGAMHYIGEASNEPSGANDPHVADYVFARAHPGDVVTWEQKEYVWTGFNWRLLGDEGSYAVKGSIRDVDIDAEANIQQSKIYNLTESLNSKVDKVEGKQLSTHDFDDEAFNKLRGIEDRAQQNIIQHIYLNNSELQPHTVNGQDKTVEINVSVFTDEDRRKLNEATTKLETIESGAQVNIIEGIKVDGNTISPNQNKIIEITTNPHTEHENIIESISFNGTVIAPDNKKQVNIVQNHHPEHENIIEEIKLNGVTQTVTNKAVNLILTESTLDIGQITGAQIPNSNEDITILNKKLQLARIAATGNIQDLLQTQDTYILIDCGTSDSDTHK